MTIAARIIIADRIVAFDETVGDDATHIALADGAILAVGGQEVLEQHAAGSTSVDHYPAATVLPGLTDGHIHPIWGMELTRGIDLTDVGPLSAIAQLLRAEADGDAAWVFGWGLDPNVFPDSDVDGRLLDAATLGKPMFLRMRDAHSGIVNSAALQLAGITGRETFADESEVELDAEGQPNGYLKELSAMALVLDRIEAEDIDTLAHRFLGILSDMAASGLTAAHVMDFAPGSGEILARAEQLGELPLRLRFAPMVFPGAGTEQLERIHRLQGTAGRRWRIDGVKFMVDGTVDNGTAWLELPDIYGESTRSIWTDPDEYIAAVQFFAERGVPTATHAIGDHAVRFVLEALSQVDPQVRALAPHRVEHIETVPDEIVARFAELGVIASMQPVHATHHTLADGSDNWSVRLGEVRSARGWRCRDLREIGVPLVLGSDWPVTPFDPKAMMADSILRRPVERPHLSPVQPEQALTARMALEGYTTHAAIAEGATAVAGRVAPGYRGDLTVLSVDPLACSPEQLASARVHATYVAGSLQHAGGPLSPDTSA